MTAEQYWEGDCELVKYYREAEQLRLEKENTKLWLQGLYIYDAIGKLAPILNPAVKKDCELVKYYREAEQLRLEKENTKLWLQGLYIYDAIGKLAPILNPAVKKGTKVKPYMEEPIPLTDKAKKITEREKQKSAQQKGIAFMQQLMLQNNKRFKGKE